MSSEQFANNATTTLGSSLSNSALTATVATGTGALFPTISGTQFFTATLWSAGNTTGVPNEIVRVTARTGDTMTIVRAQEGTTAGNWNVGDTFANYPTAAALSGLANDADIQTQTGNYAVDSGSANAGVITLSPVPANLAALVGVPIRVTKVASANTGNYTLQANGFPATAVQNIDGTQIPAGALPSLGTFEVVYNGTYYTLTSSQAKINQAFTGTTTAVNMTTSGSLIANAGATFNGGFNTPNSTGSDSSGDYTFAFLKNNNITFLNPASALATFENPGGNVLQLYYRGSTAAVATLSVGLNSTNGELVAFNFQGSNIGNITTNGSSTTYGTSSDRRLKTNLNLLSGATERLMAIPVYAGQFIGSEDKPKQDMFIADELQKIVPHAVTGEKNAEYDAGEVYYPAGTVIATDVVAPTNLPPGSSWTKTGTASVKENGEEIFIDIGLLSFPEDHVLVACVAEPVVGEGRPGTVWRFTHKQPRYQNVDHGLVTPLIVAALQEQKLRNDDLESKIKKLEALLAKKTED